MKLNNRTLIIDYRDVNTIIYHIRDGKSPEDAANILFIISPEFEDLIKEVEISAPPSENTREDVEIAINAIKDYLNI